MANAMARTASDLMTRPGNQTSLAPENVAPARVPEAIVRLLERGVIERRTLFPEGGGWRTVERWEAPDVPAHERNALIAYCDQLRAALSPAPAKVILARMLTLLSHFGGDAKRPEVETAMAMDWAEDLADYPAWAIEDAARRWRRTQKFRPRISEIIALCEEAVREKRVILQRLEATIGKFSEAPHRSEMRQRLMGIAGASIKRIAM